MNSFVIFGVLKLVAIPLQGSVPWRAGNYSAMGDIALVRNFGS